MAVKVVAVAVAAACVRPVHDGLAAAAVKMLAVATAACMRPVHDGLAATAVKMLAVAAAACVRPMPRWASSSRSQDADSSSRRVHEACAQVG